MKREFTATVHILEGDRVLLIHHRKYNKWVPPGGHMEENEIPHEAAIREAKEETGLDIELISQDDVDFANSNAKTIPRPIVMLLEEIPPHGDKPYHQHIDMIFAGRPIRGSVTLNEEETHDIRWWTLEELSQLKPGIDIFQDTLEIIKLLINNGQRRAYGASCTPSR